MTQTDNDILIGGNRTNSFGSSLVGHAASAATGAHFQVRLLFRALILTSGEFPIVHSEGSIRPAGH